MPLRRPFLTLVGLAAFFAGCRTARNPYSGASAPPAWEALSLRSATPPSARWRLEETTATYVVSLSAFDGEAPLFATRFEIEKSSYDAIDARWGYREADLAALQRWKGDARLSALSEAQKLGASQSELDGLVTVLKSEYYKARADYLAQRGFHFLPDGAVAADLAYLVRKDAPLLAPLAAALEDRAKRGRRSRRWTIEAAMLLVQSALRYEDVPAVVDGVHTGGVWPPLMTLVKGSGDCDTKAVLLAAILANVPGVHMIGMNIGGHYLLGLEGKPNAREASFVYQGRRFILLEPAGPATLPPGDVGDETRRDLKEGRPYTVERLF